MRRTRRPHVRSVPGGTDRRRRHRFPAVVPNPDLRRAFPAADLPPEPYRPLGDVDALLWEHAADLVGAVSER